MTKLYLIDLDVSSIESETFINQWLLYHVEQSNQTLKELLADMNVAQASFAYARKNGFLKSKKVLQAMINYFNLSLDINPEHHETLKNLINKSITESYFIDEDALHEVYHALIAIKDAVKHTPLYTLFALAFISVYDKKLYEGAGNALLDDDIIPFLNYLKPTLSSDLQYYYLFSLTEYYFNVPKDEEAINLTSELEALDQVVDERLKTMGYFDLFTLYALKKNYERAFLYVEKCQTLCFKYYNAKRLQAIRQNITFILYHKKDYESAVNNARGDLLFLYRDDLKKNHVFLKLMTAVLTTSLIYLERYEEALEESDKFFDFKTEDYYPQAILFKKFCFYKLKLKDTTPKLEEKLRAEGHSFPEEYDILKTLIDDLKTEKRAAMKTFGERLKPLLNNTMSHYSRLNHLLKDEYEAYLKRTNRYIDLLDMK